MLNHYLNFELFLKLIRLINELNTVLFDRVYLPNEKICKNMIYVKKLIKSFNMNFGKWIFNVIEFYDFLILIKSSFEF